MNSVELLGVYGSDETHALSAWTSTSRDLTDQKRNRIGELLEFLATNKHHTPFEKSTLHFLIHCDTASHIHVIKHRIGVSVNGESARYKQLTKLTFHTPEDWPEEEKLLYENFCLSAAEHYENALATLEQSIGRKRAKESARFYLPYGVQITLDVSFNFRSFMHFVGLRYDNHAQKEIYEIAEQMLKLTRETKKFDLSLKAFGYAD